MASEFDNEMDFLLRQAAQQTEFATDFAGESAHLEADDLSAFAENALPQSARLTFISHLADCNSCRQSLSNLILLNEAAQEETVTIAEPEKDIVQTKTFWLKSFKNLFAFPILGYATAALAVLLVGSFAFVALRVREESRSVSVAKVEPEQNDVQEAKKRAAVHAPAAAKDEENEPKQEEQLPVETPNPNTEMLAQSSTPTPAENEADILPPSMRATKGINRNSVSSNVVAPRNEASAANSPVTNSAANIAAQTKAQPASPGAGVVAKDEAADSVVAQAPAPKPEEKAKTELQRGRAKNRESEADDKNDLAENAPQMSERRAATSSASGGMNKKVVVETRTVSGKTFQSIGGVWFDSVYSSQNATKISRGSDEYKKLDSGLRSIAENLSGEILVVWQGKAYRIR